MATETHEHAVKRGTKSKKSGAAFELRVRKDLEKTWIVDKWSNNVDLDKQEGIPDFIGSKEVVTITPPQPRLIPAKHKFRGMGIPMAMGTGFPDFIAFRVSDSIGPHHYCEVIGVESKSNGYLSPEEKEKCKWLLENKIFSKILIAKKGSIRGEIIYEDFMER